MPAVVHGPIRKWRVSLFDTSKEGLVTIFVCVDLPWKVPKSQTTEWFHTCASYDIRHGGCTSCLDHRLFQLQMERRNWLYRLCPFWYTEVLSIHRLPDFAPTQWYAAFNNAALHHWEFAVYLRDVLLFPHLRMESWDCTSYLSDGLFLQQIEEKNLLESSEFRLSPVVTFMYPQLSHLPQRNTKPALSLTGQTSQVPI